MPIDATYYGAEIRCETPEQIIDLLRSFKGVNPDVELSELEVVDERALARLYQPLWDEEWFQVLTVHQGRISHMEDSSSRPDGFAASAA